MLIHPSALKHNISPENAVYAAEHAVFCAPETDEPPIAELRLGFDQNGRLLELAVLRFDSGREMLIHAMKCRPQYLDLIPPQT